MTDSPVPRLGVAYIPEIPPEGLRDLAVAADAHLDDLWVWEDCFKQSGLASAAAALAWTQQVRVGLGLMPAPLRAVPLTAMEVATVQRMFPGRFVAGMGHGVQDWMGQSGVRVASPMTLLEEQLVALNALLAGEEVTADGSYVTLDKVRLDWPPAAGEKVMAGGFGPRTLSLAARHTDGLLMAAAIGPEEFGDSLSAAHAAAPGRALEVVVTVMAVIGDGAAERIAGERQRWGLAPDAPVGVGGSAKQVAELVRAYAAHGATTVVLQPSADEPDLIGFVEAVGRDVRAELA